MGYGDKCHAYCDTYFPGSVKNPITHVLGGDQFDVFFETCVEN